MTTCFRNENTFLGGDFLPIDHDRIIIQETPNASTEMVKMVSNGGGGGSSSRSPTAQKRKSTTDADELETWNLVSNDFHGYLSRKQKHASLARKEKGILSADPLSFIQHENQTVDTRIDKVGVMVHCGVNRPLFPDIYRNVLNYCEMTDNVTVTEKLARFSLTTLATNDHVSLTYPVVFPVLNQTLMNEIEYFNVNSGINFETIKVKRNDADDYYNTPPTGIKKMKGDDDSHHDYSTNHLKQEDKQKSRSGRVTKSIDRDYDNICALDKLQSTTVVDEHKMINSTSIATTPSNLSKTDSLQRPLSTTPRVFSSTPNNAEFKLEDALKRKRGRPKAIRNTSIPSDDSSNSNSLSSSMIRTLTPKPRKGRPPTKRKIDGNSSEKTGQLVPSPPGREAVKDHTLRRPTIIENDIVPEDDLAPEFHIFGEIHCSRTYGRMVDYATRNLSSIYLFKMRRVLNLQKKHNRYFKTDCEYIRITHNHREEDEIVDVESVLSNDEPNVSHIERGLQKHLMNPLKMIPLVQEFNGFGATIMKNPVDCIERHKNGIQFVDEDLLQDKRHVKKRWIILQLIKDFESITLEDTYDLPGGLLFNVIYKADIAHRPVYQKLVSKKRECTAGMNELELGVYAVPGLSTAVLVGPLDSTFGDVPMITVSTKDKNSQNINVRNVPILPCDNNKDAVVIAKLWQPNSCWRIISNVMDKFLKFQFNRSDAILDAMEDNFTVDKLSSEQLLSEHTARTFLRVMDENEDEHFTLIHDDNGVDTITPLTTNFVRVKRENEGEEFALTHAINSPIEDGSNIPLKKIKTEELSEKYEENIESERIPVTENATKNTKLEVVSFVENSTERTDPQIIKSNEITPSTNLEEKIQVARSLESAAVLSEKLEISGTIDSVTPYVDEQILENSVSRANCSQSIEQVENEPSASTQILEKLSLDPAAVLGDEEQPSNKVETNSRPKCNKPIVDDDEKIRHQEERKYNERLRRIELKRNKSYLCSALNMSSKSKKLTVRECILEAIKEVQNLTDKNANLLKELKRRSARAKEVEEKIQKLINGVEKSSGIHKETMKETLEKLHCSKLETIDADHSYKEFSNLFSRDDRNDTTLIKHQLASSHGNEINCDNVLKSKSPTNTSTIIGSKDLPTNDSPAENATDVSTIETSKNDEINKSINFRKFSGPLVETSKEQCEEGDLINNMKKNLKDLTTENVEPAINVKSIQPNEIHTAEKNHSNSNGNISASNDHVKIIEARNEVCISLKESGQIFIGINDLKVDAEFIVTKDKIIEFISSIEKSLAANSNYNTKILLKISRLRTLLSQNDTAFQQSQSNNKLITNLKSYNKRYECIFTSPLYCEKLQHLQEKETFENHVIKEIEQSCSEFTVNTENRVFIDDSIIVEIDNSC